MIKTEDPNFVRDEDTHALINNNVSAYLMYKQQRNSYKVIATQEQRIDILEQELGEIKSLLKDLIREKNV